MVNHQIFFWDLSYKQQAASVKQQAASIKRQATGGKRPSLRLQAGGWAHRLQALGSRTLNKVSLIVERGS